MAPKAIKIFKKGTCPDWVDEYVISKKSQFLKQLKTAQESLERLPGVPRPGDIEGFHRTLFTGLTPHGARYYAGNFRRVDSALPCLAQDVQVAGIPGVPFTRVGARMHEWSDSCAQRHEDLVNGTSAQDAELLQRISEHLAHFVGEFIRIHPFINGNGRTSRALWNHELDVLGFSPNVRVHPRPEGAYPNIMAAAMLGDDRPLLKHILLSLAADAFES